MGQKETPVVMTDSKPGDLVGYVNGRPVRLFGGADGEPVVEPDDDPEGDADDTPEWTPPSREDHEKLQAALGRAQREAAERRRLLRDNGIDPRTGKKSDGADPASDDPTPAPAAPQVDKVALKRAVDAAVEKAVATTELRYRPALEKHAVKAALDTAGVDPSYRGLIARSLDLSELDFDDEGNAVGLDDQIASLKVQYPQVFKKTAASGVPRRTGGAAAVDGGQKQPPPAPKKGWLSGIDDQMGLR
jgi:hypothetical protein